MKRNSIMLITVKEYSSVDLATYFNDKEKAIQIIDLAYKLKKSWKGDIQKAFSIKNSTTLQFDSWVGIFQIGSVTFEILPKIDIKKEISQNNLFEKEEQGTCRSVLLQMLQYCGIFPQEAGLSDQMLQNSTLLEQFFKLFLKEIEEMTHRGLVKRYRKHESNLHTAKGKILWNKQISENYIHQERFYCRFTTYDRNHLQNRIFKATLQSIISLANTDFTKSLAKKLLLYFEDIQDCKITIEYFDKIYYDHKNAFTKKAMTFAKLILLNQYPSLQNGSVQSIAILFNMFALWENYIFKLLQRTNKFPKIKLKGQVYHRYWNDNLQKPDIIVIKENGEQVIIDTKWKNPIVTKIPSADDIQQVFCYNQVFGAKKGILLYPAFLTKEGATIKSGVYKGYEQTQLNTSLLCETFQLIDEKNKLNKNTEYLWEKIKE